MVHRFLMGYEVASSDWSRPGVVVEFLRAIAALHREMGMPCTLFVRGQTLEEHPEDFRRISLESGPLIDIQQASYSGLPLKSICQENHQGMAVFRGGALRECRDDVARAVEAFERLLGMRPIGLSGPLGYYRGLSDRPDLIEMLERLGIRFMRTYTRNARDWSPVAFETQPFWYAPQGCPDVLEIPGQGWPDHLLREALGSDEAYVRHIKKDLDYIAAKGLTWSYVQTDWSTLLEGAGLPATRAVLEYVARLGFKVQTHLALYEELLTARTQAK